MVIFSGEHLHPGSWLLDLDIVKGAGDLPGASFIKESGPFLRVLSS